MTEYLCTIKVRTLESPAAHAEMDFAVRASDRKAAEWLVRAVIGANPLAGHGPELTLDELVVVPV